MWNIMQWFTE